MPVKVTYTSTIIKQCYHYGDSDSGKPYFNEDAIGVPFPEVLYAENKETAYDLLAKWSNDPNREYCITSVDVIIHDEIPRNVFFYETEHFGKRLDMENYGG